MSMTKEAVQLITDTALQAAGKALPTQTPTVVLPDGCQVVTLEKWQAGRSRFRGIYSTHSLADFSAYVAARAMSQKELSDWIEDWHQYLTPVDDEGKAIPVAKAIAAVRTITVKASSESETTVGDTSASRSAMDQIEARSKETLPAALLFSVIPFEGLTEQQINLRISVITSGAVPALKLRWVGEEVQREDIAQEFKTVLQEKIGSNASLALGSFDPK